ncbi:MMPL family protein [compost metagenome]
MLLLVMRSVRDTLLVLAPVAFAAIVTGGICVLTGLPLNFANIIALPLLIGVTVDSGIHIVYRMRTEPPQGGNPLRTSTSRAVVASALTTVASFGNLAFASHNGMASMGQLLTIGMLMSLVGALVILPALMRLGRRT